MDSSFQLDAQSTLAATRLSSTEQSLWTGPAAKNPLVLALFISPLYLLMPNNHTKKTYGRENVYDVS